MRSFLATLALALAAPTAEALVVPGSSFELTFDPGGTDSLDANGNIVSRIGGVDDPADRPTNGPGSQTYGAGVPITGDGLSGGLFQDRGYYDDRFGVTFQSVDGPLTLFQSNCDPDGVGVFPTCSGGDPDLGTGSYFGTAPQGLTLISQETNGSNNNTDRVPGSGSPAWWANPDDDLGYDIIANFRTTNPVPSDTDYVFFQYGVTVEEVLLVDQETTEAVSFFATTVDGLRYELTSDFYTTSLVTGSPGGIPNGADNDILTVAFTGLNRNLRAFEVIFEGSGNLGVLGFSASTAVPLPPAALLLGAGVGILAWRGRRRAAA
jgi:hypothetical protein